MLQRVGIKNNVNLHFSLNFKYFVMKRSDLNALLSFFLVILRFSAIRNLLRDLSLFEFPLIRRVKATYSILKSLLLNAKKETLEAC